MTYQLVATHPYASIVPDTCGYGKYLLGSLVYHDKIYFGWGNWHKVSCEGTKILTAFDPLTQTFEDEYLVASESIYDFRVYNDALYVPHIDPHSGIKGNYTGLSYSKKENEIWTSHESEAWHIFDIQKMNGHTYLIGSINNPGQGVVFESSDNEITFQNIFQQGTEVTTRFHFSFIWDNKLYVQADELSQCMIYDGFEWQSGSNLLPNGGKGFFANHFSNKVIYISKDQGLAGKLYAFNGINSTVIKSNVIKYGIYNDTLYLIQTDGRISKTVNLTSWESLNNFTLAAPTCITGYNDQLFIGTSNSKVYTYDL